MFRLTDRLFLAGVSVVVPLLALSIWAKHDAHRAPETDWSSRQRGAIVSGAVHEEPAASAPVVASEAPAVAQAASADTDAAPVQTVEAARKPANRPHAARRHRVVTAPRVTAKTNAPAKHDEAAAQNAPVVHQVAPPVAQAPPVVAVPPPSPSPSPSPSPVANVAPSQAVSTSSGPKTRKQVQDELRRARADGAMPRFGNPDPYGPGGSPSYSSE
jgi:hypothetical protein